MNSNERLALLKEVSKRFNRNKTIIPLDNEETMCRDALHFMCDTVPNAEEYNRALYHSDNY